MKKQLMTACLFYSMLTVQVLADDSKVLQDRLNKVNSFYASFTQKVNTAEGNEVQSGKGELWMKRPNLFNWHMTAPDESILVSDGKTIWFYDPFLEQATANNLKNTISNTPFMLIIRNSDSDWNQYNVQQHGDNFLLVKKTDCGNIKQFTINVNNNGTISEFTTMEQDGQISAYQIKIKKNSPVDDAKFHFSLPKGVTLDDQRQ